MLGVARVSIVTFQLFINSERVGRTSVTILTVACMQERLLTETREMAAKDVVKEEFNASNKAPYDTLLKEFQETRQQLAEARVHIDRLRFGANFTIDHCFELLFKHQFASPQPTGSTCSLPKQAWTSSCQEGGIPAVDVLNALSSKQPAVTVGMEDAGTSPLPRGDALNHIRELRDQVNTVASTINDSNASPEEQCDQLTALQLEHQKMIKDIGSFLHEGEDEKKTLLQEEVSKFMTNEVTLLFVQIADRICRPIERAK